MWSYLNLREYPKFYNLGMNHNLILVVKYRKKVIDDEISENLKEIFIKYGELHEVKLLEWEHDKDHIHMLIKTTPKITLSKFIGNFKSYPSRAVKTKFPRIKRYYGSQFSGQGHIASYPVEAHH